MWERCREAKDKLDVWNSLVYSCKCISKF